MNREARRRKKKDSALRVNLFKSTLLEAFEHAGSGGTRSCHSRPPTGGGGEKTKHTSGLLFALERAAAVPFTIQDAYIIFVTLLVRE